MASMISGSEYEIRDPPIVLTASCHPVFPE